MSWLRTQLVLFAIGLLYLKVTKLGGFTSIPAIGFIAIVSSIIGGGYCRYRFTQLFENNMAVSIKEYWVKIFLSSLILLLAVGYVVFLWIA